jgi:hypothetical protein
MYLNKSFTVLTIFIMAIIFTGCGARGAYFNKFEQPADGNASIYVYRPAMFFRGGMRYNIIISDDNNITEGLMSNGAYIYTQVPANREIEIKTNTTSVGSILIDTENQKTYCMKSYPVQGFISRATIMQVDMKTCKKEIINTQLHE